MDAVGEWATTSAWIGTGNKIKPYGKLIFLILLECFIQPLHIFVVSRSIQGV